MPATLEDPTQPPHYRPDIVIPELEPLTVLLKDGETTATIYPIFPNDQLPFGLLAFLCDEFNVEIERGDTYPLFDTLHIDTFQNYWFGSFAAVMLLGDSPTIQDSRQWEKECLGTFYAKPNYPGRCSHICTAGFLVNAGIRGKGIGRTLAECYLEWAPKLGYSYSVFNLVFETNVAACRIWESLHFTRIGRVKDAGILKGHETAIDAIIYGRDLIDPPEDTIEQRFDRIKFYLETGRYPPQSDRQEKSRLRSSAAHYKLVDDKLMLKGREVVSDPDRQLQIATEMHMINHAGINKTTSQITEKYHWTRIKSTVSMAIRNCAECRETTRPPPKRFKREMLLNNGSGMDFSLGGMSSSPSQPLLSQTAATRNRHLSHSGNTPASGFPQSTQGSDEQHGSNLAPGLVSIPGSLSIHNSSNLHHLSGLASQVQQREQQRQQPSPSSQGSHEFDHSVGIIASSGQSHRSEGHQAQDIAAQVVAQMSNQRQQFPGSRSSDEGELPVDPQISSAFSQRSHSGDSDTQNGEAKDSGLEKSTDDTSVTTAHEIAAAATAGSTESVGGVQGDSGNDETSQMFQDELFRTAAAVAAAAVAAGNEIDIEDERHQSPEDQQTVDSERLVAAAAAAVTGQNEEMNTDDFACIAEIATGEEQKDDTSNQQETSSSLSQW